MGNVQSRQRGRSAEANAKVAAQNALLEDIQNFYAKDIDESKIESFVRGKLSFEAMMRDEADAEISDDFEEAVAEDQPSLHDREDATAKPVDVATEEAILVEVEPAERTYDFARIIGLLVVPPNIGERIFGGLSPFPDEIPVDKIINYRNLVSQNLDCYDIQSMETKYIKALSDSAHYGFLGEEGIRWELLRLIQGSVDSCLDLYTYVDLDLNTYEDLDLYAYVKSKNVRHYYIEKFLASSELRIPAEGEEAASTSGEGEEAPLKTVQKAKGVIPGIFIEIMGDKSAGEYQPSALAASLYKFAEDIVNNPDFNFETLDHNQKQSLLHLLFGFFIDYGDKYSASDLMQKFSDFLFNTIENHLITEGIRQMHNGDLIDGSGLLILAKHLAKHLISHPQVFRILVNNFEGCWGVENGIWKKLTDYLSAYQEAHPSYFQSHKNNLAQVCSFAPKSFCLMVFEKLASNPKAFNIVFDGFSKSERDIDHEDLINIWPSIQNQLITTQQQETSRVSGAGLGEIEPHAEPEDDSTELSLAYKIFVRLNSCRLIVNLEGQGFDGDSAEKAGEADAGRDMLTDATEPESPILLEYSHTAARQVLFIYSSCSAVERKAFWQKQNDKFLCPIEHLSKYMQNFLMFDSNFQRHLFDREYFADMESVIDLFRQSKTEITETMCGQAYQNVDKWKIDLTILNPAMYWLYEFVALDMFDLFADKSTEFCLALGQNFSAYVASKQVRNPAEFRKSFSVAIGKLFKNKKLTLDAFSQFDPEFVFLAFLDSIDGQNDIEVFDCSNRNQKEHLIAEYIAYFLRTANESGLQVFIKHFHRFKIAFDQGLWEFILTRHLNCACRAKMLSMLYSLEQEGERPFFMASLVLVFSKRNKDELINVLVELAKLVEAKESPLELLAEAVGEFAGKVRIRRIETTLVPLMILLLRVSFNTYKDYFNRWSAPLREGDKDTRLLDFFIQHFDEIIHDAQHPAAIISKFLRYFSTNLSSWQERIFAHLSFEQLAFLVQAPICRNLLDEEKIVRLAEDKFRQEVNMSNLTLYTNIIYVCGEQLRQRIQDLKRQNQTLAILTKGQGFFRTSRDDLPARPSSAPPQFNYKIEGT